MSKILRYAGIALEDGQQIESPSSADFHVDISGASLDAASDSHMEYEGGFGRGKRVHRPGFYSPSGNIVYAADIRTIVSMLYAALGGYEFTADGGENSLNLHEIWAVDDRNLPPFTARLGKDSFEHVFVGCIVNSIQFEVSDEFAELTVDVVSVKDKKASLLSLSSLLLPEEYPLSFPDVKFSIGGEDRSADVRSLTLNVNNNANAEQGRGLGSRFPSRIPVDSREVELDLDIRYDNTAELEKFWGSSDGASSEGSVEDDMKVELDAGGDGSAEILIPRGLFTEIQIQPSGRSEIEQSVEVQAFSADVELEDAATTVTTDIYVRVSNDQSDVRPTS